VITVQLRPHHLLDIISQHGAGTPFEPSEYGHALHTVAAAVLADPQMNIEFVVDADDICAPCKHLVNGRCDDVLRRFDPPKSKQEYNDDLDRRLFVYLGMAEGATMTFARFLRLIREHLDGLEQVCTHPGEDAARRRENLERGLDKLQA